MTFAIGMDEGSGRNLLLGFREFLLTRIGGQTGLALPWLVLWLVEPVGPKDVDLRALPGDLDAAAVISWYQLLDEFLTAREARDGLLTIHRRYFGTIENRGP